MIPNPGDYITLDLSEMLNVADTQYDSTPHGGISSQQSFGFVVAHLQTDFDVFMDETTIVNGKINSGIPTGEMFGDRKMTVCSVVRDTPGSDLFIANQLPEFVRDDHPRFVTFLKSYYRWLEENNNVVHKIKRIKKYQDIDETNEEFAEHLYKEFFAYVPRNILADKRMLLKHIRQFYRAKGTEKSFKLFFRILFNSNVEFYYPRTDVLRVSDGKWIQNKSMRVIPIRGELKDFSNMEVRGQVSGTTAFVDRAIGIREGVYSVYELPLNTSSISGAFLPNEIIEVIGNPSVTARISTVPIKTELILDPINIEYITGTGYKIGDTFRLSNGGIGVGGELRVSAINPLDTSGQTGSIRKVEVIKVGAEYLKYDAKYGRDKVTYAFEFDLSAENCISSNFIGQGARVLVHVGPLTNYPGFYLNTDGQLNESKYLQDGEFYQQFSYVTITDQSTSYYGNALKQLLHPAGLKFFGWCRSTFSLTKQIHTASVQFRRTMQQFPHIPVYPIQSPKHIMSNRPIPAMKNAKTEIAIRHDIMRDRRAFGLGPSYTSISRDVFNYKPIERYDANTEMSDINSGYWGDPRHVSTLYGNTTIDNFKDMIPCELEGVPDGIVVSGLPRITQKSKESLGSITEGQVIFNLTHKVVEIYTNPNWREINPTRRINILPDVVVTANQQVILDDDGNWALTVSCLASTDACGEPNITILMDK